MSKVFVSLPMRGFSDKEIEVNLKKAEVLVKNQLGKNFEIVSSYFKEDEVPKGVKLGANRAYMLGRAIQMLSECDAILMYGDWICAKGCMIEFLVAKNYNIPILKINYGTGKIVENDKLFHNFQL